MRFGILLAAVLASSAISNGSPLSKRGVFNLFGETVGSGSGSDDYPLPAPPVPVASDSPALATSSAIPVRASRSLPAVPTPTSTFALASANAEATVSFAAIPNAEATVSFAAIPNAGVDRLELKLAKGLLMSDAVAVYETLLEMIQEKRPIASVTVDKVIQLSQETQNYHSVYLLLEQRFVNQESQVMSILSIAQYEKKTDLIDRLIDSKIRFSNQMIELIIEITKDTTTKPLYDILKDKTYGLYDKQIISCIQLAEAFEDADLMLVLLNIHTFDKKKTFGGLQIYEFNSQQVKTAFELAMKLSNVKLTNELLVKKYQLTMEQSTAAFNMALKLKNNDLAANALIYQLRFLKKPIRKIRMQHPNVLDAFKISLKTEKFNEKEKDRLVHFAITAKNAEMSTFLLDTFTFNPTVVAGFYNMSLGTNQPSLCLKTIEKGLAVDNGRVEAILAMATRVPKESVQPLLAYLVTKVRGALSAEQRSRILAFLSD